MTPPERLKLIREFTAKYRARIVKGLATYGEFDKDTDTRILSREAQEEVLDVGSYLEFLEIKHPDPNLQLKIQRVRAKAILLYGELKQLEQDELIRTPARGGIA